MDRGRRLKRNEKPIGNVEKRREKREKREEDEKEKERRQEAEQKEARKTRLCPSNASPGESEHQRTCKRRPKRNRRHKKEGCGPRTTEQACSVQRMAACQSLSRAELQRMCAAQLLVGSTSFFGSIACSFISFFFKSCSTSFLFHFLTIDFCWPRLACILIALLSLLPLFRDIAVSFV